MLLWLTFAAIMNTGLELGIFGGIVMATLYHAYEYAQARRRMHDPYGLYMHTPGKVHWVGSHMMRVKCPK